MTNSNKTWNRVYAVGDIHGDLSALVEIFTGLGLIDSSGRWSAQPHTLVVLLGDLIDRGGDSANLVAYVMSLQEQAREADSYVELLLGNHELMAAVGDYRYLCPVEGASLNDLWIADQCGPSAIFRGSSRYAQWLRTRPLMVRIGDALLVHAGIGEWAAGQSTEHINAVASQWMGYFQGHDQPPSPEDQWVVGDEGPLWTRNFAWTTVGTPATAISKPRLMEIAQSFDCERMIVGHCPTLEISFAASTFHPHYGDAVVNLDTGISQCFGGRLSALEMEGGNFRVRYFPRSFNAGLIRTIREFGAEQRQSLADCYAACA